MKLNEGKFRSPKWLRNYVDFEVNTGDDISGEPSKRKTAKIEKEKQEKEYAENIEKLKRKRQKIEKELNRIYYSLISDFSDNPYSDKTETPIINGKIVFKYTFEDKKIIKLYKKDNKTFLEYDINLYTLGDEWTDKFIRLANEIIDNGEPRKSSGRSGYDRYNSYSSGYQKSNSNSSQQRKANTPPKWQDHPKGTIYQTLKDTIKLREEQLKKVTGSEKQALQNELDAAKTMLTNLNKKYSFESNIQNFSLFSKIYEKSKFVDNDEFNEILDKINDGGITSLTDIEKKRLDLFSMDDEPITDLIDRMADISSEFKLKDKNLQKDEWDSLNDEMMKIEKEIEAYGIDLGDEIFKNLMNKQRSDVFGYDFDKEGDDEFEMDI